MTRCAANRTERRTPAPNMELEADASLRPVHEKVAPPCGQTAASQTGEAAA